MMEYVQWNIWVLKQNHLGTTDIDISPSTSAETISALLQMLNLIAAWIISNRTIVFPQMSVW